MINMFDIRPLTCDNPEDGAEPSIRQLLIYYYITHDVPFKEAEKLAEKYIVQLLKDYDARS